MALASCKVLVPVSEPEKKSIRLWATYYYVPTLAHSEQGIPLLDTSEQELPLKLIPCDWCTAGLQGSVYIKKEGQIFLAHYAGRSEVVQYDCRECHKFRNYAGYDKTGKVRWEISQGKVTGAVGLPLVPYKSVAVDPSVIPYESVLFIPEAVGTLYPDLNGLLVRHDGYFLAADTGSLIKGHHIDVFLGPTLDNPFDFVKSREESTFQAFVVENSLIKQELLDMHR